MDNIKRFGTAPLGAGELPSGGSDGGGYGAGRHFHPQPINAHTHQDHAQEAQFSGILFNFNKNNHIMEFNFINVFLNIFGKIKSVYTVLDSLPHHNFLHIKC